MFSLAVHYFTTELSPYFSSHSSIGILKSAPAAISTYERHPHATTHYLPGNPMPYLAPSATHQPELLLLAWMIATLHALVDSIQQHPLVSDPVPDQTFLTDRHSFRLYIQLRNALRHLGNLTLDIQQGIRILHFLLQGPETCRQDPGGLSTNGGSSNATRYRGHLRVQQNNHPTKPGMPKLQWQAMNDLAVGQPWWMLG